MQRRSAFGRLRAAMLVPACLAILLTACGPRPIEGDDLAALKAQLAARRTPPMLLVDVLPESLGKGDPDPRLYLRAYSGSNEVTKFVLADIYFRTAFTVVEELRALGLTVDASPDLWSRRLDAEIGRLEKLVETEVDAHIAWYAVWEDAPGLQEMHLESKRELLAIRKSLLAARTSLPPPPPVRPLTGRELRDRFFAKEEAPVRPFELVVEVLDLRAEAHGVEPVEASGISATEAEAMRREGATAADPNVAQSGERRVYATLRLTARRRGAATGQGLLATVTQTREVTADGSGVLLEKPLNRYGFAILPDDPLDRALRFIARDFAAVLAERLPPRK